MKKFIFILFLLITNVINTNAFYPVLYNRVTNNKIEIFNKKKDNVSLILDIKFDNEQITFFATNKIKYNNTIYIIGDNKQVKVIGISDNQLKIITNNNKIITIDNIKVDDRLIEDINNLPNT